MISPIKNSLFALSTALVMGVSVQSVHATDNGPSQETTQDQIGKDWVLIQQINGISISYSLEVLGQERFLSVQFVNTNSEALDFIWSMTKNGSAIIISEDEMMESRIQLEAYTAKTFDGTYIIELGDEDQLSDFIISIEPTKH